MAVKPIPEGFHTVTPYLVVKGAAALIEFLKQAFDAQELHVMKDAEGNVRHAEIRIGDSPIMLGESTSQWQPMPAGIYLYVPDTDATYKKAMAAGASSIMEPADQFYGDRNGGVKDAWGNFWWIGTHVEDVSPEEMERRAAAHAKH